MARAIDASELIVEIQVCSWDSEQDKERAEDIVLGMPTLTPPNEPLTLEKLREMEDNRIGTLGCGKKVLRHIGISWTPSVQSA